MTASFLAQFLNRTLPPASQQALARFAGRRIEFACAGLTWRLQIAPAGQWAALPEDDLNAADLRLQIQGSDFVWLVHGVDALSRRAQIAGDAGLLEAVGTALKTLDPQLLWATDKASLAAARFPMAQALVQEGLSQVIKTLPRAASALSTITEHLVRYTRDERAWLVTKQESEQRDAQLLHLSDTLARLEARLALTPSVTH